MERGEKRTLVYAILGVGTLCGVLLYQGCNNPETKKVDRPYYEGRIEVPADMKLNAEEYRFS
jgi:hypothetical protein